MSRPAARTVLLIEARPAGTDTLAADLTRLGAVKVVRVRSLDAALDTLATMPVDAVVGVHQPPELEGLVLLRALHGEDQRQDPAIVLLAEQDAATIRIAAWREGVDAILTWPADPVDVAGALMVLMERRAAERSRSSRISGPDDSIRRLVGLLTATLDVAVPGARARGEALATAAVAVANAFDVPTDLLPPMEYAARLHEIGRISTNATPTPASGYGLSSEVTLAGSALLGEIPALADAAMLLEGMGANWDGSGSPTDLQQGQIPMRSRILRGVHDLLAAADRIPEAGTGRLAVALASLGQHAGTWYDPAVLAAMEVLVSTEMDPNWLRHQELVPPARLREGMILAADLHTASGVKLLSAGSVLNQATLDLIRRRHLSDPILHGIPIRPTTG
jgi:response regulator RpfG family c-di-GMP phosphodiesterase